MATIPDVDLSRVGVTKFGNFVVEVVDPVADYVELMEVDALYENLCTLILSCHFEKEKQHILLPILVSNMFCYAECF